MAVIRKAILTGGGLATRLRPVTATLNKHLIPLANKPMIQHAIEKVCEVGVREIFINTNPGDTQLEKALGNGDRFGVSITYFEQTGGPQGIAHFLMSLSKTIWIACWHFRKLLIHGIWVWLNLTSGEC